MGGLAVMQSTRVAAIDSKVFKAEQVRQLYWLALSSLILILQLLLWWILYKVPQWAQG